MQTDPAAAGSQIIVTAILVPACTLTLGLFLKRMVDNLYRGWEKYEAEKEKNIVEWRNRYQETLCAIKRSVESLQDCVHTKASVEDQKELAAILEDHGERIAVLEIKVQDLRDRTGGGP
jgi:hypothetical protein